MADEFDPYAPGTGLKDDFDGTIMDTTMFVKVEGQQNMAFQLQVRADDGEEVEQRYGVGGEWMTYDGGKTVEHPKGHNRQFNGQTAYSQLIVNALMTGPEARELFYAANRNRDNRGPQYAEVWHGMRFHFKIVEVDGQQRVEVQDEAGNKTGEFEWVARKQNRMFPTAFLGMVGAEGTPAPAQPTPPASSPTPEATAQPQLTATTSSTPPPAPTVGTVEEYAAFNALDMRDRAKMKLLAASAEDYRKFADQAAIIELAAEPGRYMIDVDPMMPLLSAEAFYVWLKG